MFKHASGGSIPSLQTMGDYQKWKSRRNAFVTVNAGGFSLPANEKTFVRENKLKSDLAPEVGGTDFWSFLIVPGGKIYLGKQTKKCPSSRSRGG